MGNNRGFLWGIGRVGNFQLGKIQSQSVLMQIIRKGKNLRLENNKMWLGKQMAEREKFLQ